jgi:hypothetical protein
VLAYGDTEGQRFPEGQKPGYQVLQSTRRKLRI